MGQAKQRGSYKLRRELAIEKKEAELKARREFYERMAAAQKTNVKTAASLALLSAVAANVNTPRGLSRSMVHVDDSPFSPFATVNS